MPCPSPCAPLAPPAQFFLRSLPLVPAEFHLPLTLDASWPLTSCPAARTAPHSSAQPQGPVPVPRPSHTHTCTHTHTRTHTHTLAPTWEKLWLRLPPSSCPAVLAMVQMLLPGAGAVREHLPESQPLGAGARLPCFPVCLLGSLTSALLLPCSYTMRSS